MKKEIYLDNAATTKIDEKVLKAMANIYKNCYANPSSVHFLGLQAKEQLEKARDKIAKFINAEKEEIYFTSGGTESNNLILKGLALANPSKKHIITSEIEHPSILETCKKMEREGYEVDYLKVNSDGNIKIADLKKLLRPNTLVVSIMHVNNEIGVLEPIEEIGKICSQNNVYFHTDAVQSFGKLDLDVKKNIDLLSASAHKINGPKGMGLVYIRKGVVIKPILNGGGQEKGIRSGTENVPEIVGFATAIEIKKNKEEIKKSRDYIIQELLKIKSVKINGSLTKRIYNNINISFYGIEGESLLMLLSKEGLFVSTGSACNSQKLTESHVLKAIGAEPMYINGTIRITLDKPLTKKELKYLVSKIKSAVHKLREISPFKLNEGGTINEKEN